MRFLSQFVRTSVTAGSILAFVLLAASTAEAAHAHAHTARRAVAARRACDARKTTLKQFKRTPHHFGGPVMLPSQRALIGLHDPTTRVARATQTDDDDDSAAIQNDAPAARIDIDSRGVPVLRPLGLLTGTATARPRPSAHSPKSPRGPPLAA